MQEGANINKSLTTLGKVISALAETVGQYQVTNWIFILNDVRKCTQFLTLTMGDSLELNGDSLFSVLYSRAIRKGKVILFPTETLFSPGY